MTDKQAEVLKALRDGFAIGEYKPGRGYKVGRVYFSMRLMDSLFNNNLIDENTITDDGLFSLKEWEASR